MGATKHFLFVGLAYFLTAVLGAGHAVIRAGCMEYPKSGLGGRCCGYSGRGGAFACSRVRRPRGTPSVVMADECAGAPIGTLSSRLATSAGGGLSSIKPQLFWAYCGGPWGCLGRSINRIRAGRPPAADN